MTNWRPLVVESFFFIQYVHDFLEKRMANNAAAAEDKDTLADGVVRTGHDAGGIGGSASAGSAMPRKTLPVSKKEVIKAWIEGFDDVGLRWRVSQGVTAGAAGRRRRGIHDDDLLGAWH